MPEEILKRFISETTLKDLIEDEDDYNQIRDMCIIMATGIDEEQKEEAYEKLREYVPKGMSVIIGSIFNPDRTVRAITWCEKDSPYCHIIGEMPAHVKTFIINGEIEYFPVN